MDKEKLALHLKYRPEKFEDFLGRKTPIDSLISVLDRDQGVPHSFLFIGPTGCGKTTLARITGKVLDCHDREFREYNTANTRGIDTVRDIGGSCWLAPLAGDVKVYLIDECHKLTNDAQNALLKILEDTPPHVYFILCTTNPEKLIKTIPNRCSTFQVFSLNRNEIFTLLKDVCKKEGVELSGELLKEIARKALGSPRQALVLLDQVIDMSNESALKYISETIVNESAVIDLCRLLIENKNSDMKWKEMAKLLRGLKDSEPEQVRYAILGYLQAVLLSKGDPALAEMMGCFMDSFIYSGNAGLVYSCFLACRA